MAGGCFKCQILLLLNILCFIWYLSLLLRWTDNRYCFYSPWSRWEFGCWIPCQQNLVALISKYWYSPRYWGAFPEVPRGQGSRWVAGSCSCSFVPLFHHAKLFTSEVSQHRKFEACNSLTSISAEIFFFYLWAKDAQRQLLFVTLFILVLNNAAKSVSRTATRKKPQLFRCDIHKLLSAVAGELLEMGTSSKALRSPWWKEHHLLGWSPNSQWELLWCTGAASALQMLCIQTYILGRSAKEFCNSWLDQDVTNSKLQFSLKQPV